MITSSKLMTTARFEYLSRLYETHAVILVLSFEHEHVLSREGNILTMFGIIRPFRALSSILTSEIAFIKPQSSFKRIASTSSNSKFSTSSPVRGPCIRPVFKQSSTIQERIFRSSCLIQNQTRFSAHFTTSAIRSQQRNRPSEERKPVKSRQEQDNFENEQDHKTYFQDSSEINPKPKIAQLSRVSLLQDRYIHINR